VLISFDLLRAPAAPLSRWRDFGKSPQSAARPQRRAYTPRRVVADVTNNAVVAVEDVRFR
jgi:hypothetical protein